MIDQKSSEPPTLKWLFFSFRGRIARRSFALGAFFLLLPQLYFLLQIGGAQDSGCGIGFFLLGFFVSVILSIWSLFALFVKRLHDIGLPGALSLLVVFSGINLLLFLALSFWPSKQEVNEHGPPPFGLNE